MILGKYAIKKHAITLEMKQSTGLRNILLRILFTLVEKKIH